MKMKEFSKMKMAFGFGKVLFPAIALGLMITVSSCDNDDDSKVPTISVTDVEGAYAGKMYVVEPTPLAEGDKEEPQGTDVNATVKTDSVRFEKFPVDGIIAKIVGEENAPAIIEKIGDINYKIGYKASMSTKQDSIYMVFDPKPLELTVGEGEAAMKVKVTITTPDKGNYAYESKQLKFPLVVENIEIGSAALPGFEAMSFTFDLKKK